MMPTERVSEQVSEQVSEEMSEQANDRAILCANLLSKSVQASMIEPPYSDQTVWQYLHVQA